MSKASPYPMHRERNLILALLLVLAAGAWALLVWQMLTMNSSSAMSQDMNRAINLTMGMATPLFLAIWVVMMVAMMFPTAAPMILVFSRVYATRKQSGRAFVPTWVFVSGYLAMWTLFGAAAYAAALGVDKASDRYMWLSDNAPRIAGGLFILAGLYQLSPLKRACLSKCRTPLDFIMQSWRDGYGGALIMGFKHGVYCLGCCWLLFIILLPLGMMNVAAMAVITLLIFAEKSLPISQLTSRLAAMTFLVYGVVVAFLPQALPTVL